MRKSFTIISLLFVSLLIFNSCEEVENTINDVQKTAALRNVSFTYDGLTTDVVMPEAGFEGKTFAELFNNSKEKYSNPANYSVNLGMLYTASNTKSNAADAKFAGMIQDVVLNNIDETPLRFDTPGFEIAKGESKTISSSSEINLETHKLAGLYIFEQIVAGEDLDTRVLTSLNYDFGLEEGILNLPEVQKNIPTKASEETKTFLRGLLESGLFDEE
jgi:hypothetical protein